MTIREAIIDSVTKHMERDESGELVEAVPFVVFKTFLMSMASILMVDAATRIDKDILENEQFKKVLAVMSHNDIFHGLGQYMQLNDFLTWWLEKDTEDYHDESDDNWTSWDDPPMMIKAWNDYVKMRR